MSFSKVFGSACGVVVALALLGPAMRPSAQAPALLFADGSTDAARPQPEAPTPRPFVVRSRTTTLDAPTLQRAIASPSANAFTLNLFDDATFAVTFERTEESGLGQRSWVGHITGRPLSTVILTLGGDFVSGLVRDEHAMFEITGVGNGLHRIEQLNTTAMTPIGDGAVPAAVDVADLAKSLDLSAPAARPGADVLVYYSTGVRVQAGGTAQAEARVARYVAETNTALARSQINGQLRLLGALEVPAPDGANPDVILSAMQTHPLVQGHRNLGGVDLVALLMTHMQSNLPGLIQCGLAYIGPGVNAAFSVTATQSECDAGFSFTHEIGHNLGGQHATEDGVEVGPNYPSYARGYKAPNRAFHTVMAYFCPNNDCPPILNFSNPNVLASPPMPAQATGTANHFNARRVHELFPFVSSYRIGRIPPSAPQGFQGSASGSTVALAWNPPAGGGWPVDYLLEAGTAPGLANIAGGIPFGDTSLSVPGVPPGTYFLRVRARNGGGISPPSNEVGIVVR